MAKKKNIVTRAKGTMNLLLAAAILCGWLLAVGIVLGDDAAAEQNAMIHTAKVFLEDKLYVRAAAQYQKALAEYQTENNPIYEEELLAVYREAGMENEYYFMIDSRIKNGKAGKDEYIERAQEYIRRGSNANAMRILKQGLEKWEDEGLTKLYESVSYEHSFLTTVYTKMSMPFSNWYIPVWDGEHWGYVGAGGRMNLAFVYEEATPFSGSYAVVKIDGVYTLIDRNGYWNAVDKNGLDGVEALAGTRIVGVKDGKYGIYSNTFQLLSNEVYENVCLSDNGMIMVQKEGRWALLNSKLEAVTEYQFTDVAVNSKGQAFSGGYAVVADERGYYLIRPDGEACFENRFTAAKGTEGGLFAIQDASGKWGFADGEGKIVVECQYEDANSFSDRLAAVEYAGKWGYINKYGEMMIEPLYEKAYPFLEGNALAVDEKGRYRIITLKNYSLF